MTDAYTKEDGKRALRAVLRASLSQLVEYGGHQDPDRTWGAPVFPPYLEAAEVALLGAVGVEDHKRKHGGTTFRMVSALITTLRDEDTPTILAGEGDSVAVHGSPEAAGEGGAEDASDEMYKRAVALVVGTQVASVGVLREQYDIDYTRAVNILDKMAEHGLVSVGCIGESSQRRVLWTAEQWAEIKEGGQEASVELYERAVAFVIETQNAVAYALQKHFDIEQPKAELLIYRMAEQGIVSTGCIGTSTVRRVLITPTEWECMKRKYDQAEASSAHGGPPAEDAESATANTAGDGLGEGASDPPSDAAGGPLDADARAALVAEIREILERDWAKAYAEKFCRGDWRMWASDTLYCQSGVEGMEAEADRMTDKTKLEDLSDKALGILHETLPLNLAAFAKTLAPAGETTD